MCPLYNKNVSCFDVLFSEKRLDLPMTSANQKRMYEVCCDLTLPHVKLSYETSRHGTWLSTGTLSLQAFVI